MNGVVFRNSALAVIGLGCMRLSALADADAAIAVVHAALDAGVVLLDTANVYAPDAEQVGHNERLVAAALAVWRGTRSVEIATKGGLTRAGSRWSPDGRARHLREACEASLITLGVPRIPLYQLHAVDPRTSIETSVRALAALQKEGWIEKIGLCNVNVGHIQAARRIVDISTIQVSLSPFDEENFRNGVAEFCRDEGIRLLAYRPLGGADRDRCSRDAVLVEIATSHGVTPHEIALAWLLDLSPHVVPLPGPTRLDHAHALARAGSIELGGHDRDRLDRRFPAGRLLRVPRASRRPRRPTGDVVLVIGMPGAGKSTIARRFVHDGYVRLNRDERGGRLADLTSTLEDGLRRGTDRWVLDNTYATRRSRNDVIECAWRHGVAVRCIHLQTTVADAQINAIHRLLEAHGRLPMPDELRTLGKTDHRFFGPDAQFRYERAFEPPTTDEGFETVEASAFQRGATERTGDRALILDFDLCAGAGNPVLVPADVRTSAEWRQLLRSYHDRSWRILFTAWRPQAAGNVADASVEACQEALRAQLGFEVAFAYCPHPAGPPICWCRKPLPGRVLEFLWKHGMSPTDCRLVASSPPDRTMAERCGLECAEADVFLGGGVAP